MDWAQIAERRIQEAQERGDFDDLGGKGKPLDLRENPLVKPGWCLAHRILRNAGFTLDWIELDNTIRAELAHCQIFLRNQLLWANHVLRSGRDEKWIEAELEDVYRWTRTAFSQRAEKLNEQIELLNLQVPLAMLQRPKIRVAEELRRLEESWPRATASHSVETHFHS